MVGKNKRIIAACVIGILITATTTLLFVEFDSPQLGKAVLQQASDAAGIELSAKRFRLKLIKGLILEDVQANGKYPGGNFYVNANQLLLEHDLLSLLRGKIRIHTAVLQYPEVRLIPQRETSAKKDRLKSRVDKQKRQKSQTPAAAEETKSARKLDLQVSKLNVQDGKIVFLRSNQKEEVLQIEDFNVELTDIATKRTPADTLALFANGTIDAKRGHISGIVITEIKGNLNATPESNLLENIQLKLSAGEVQIKVLKINLAENPVRYSMEAKSSAINMNHVLMAEQQGDMGPAQIILNLEGTHGQDPQGYGTISLGEGKLPDAPVFDRIDAFLKGKTKLVGLPYKALPAKYTLNGNRITLPDLEIQTTAGRLRTSGWTNLNGVASLEVQVLIPREQVRIKELPPAALDLMTDAKGEVNVPFRVDGPIENPLVELDLERMGRTAGEAIQREGAKTLKEAAKDAIRNFFKKRKKPD